MPVSPTPLGSKVPQWLASMVFLSSPVVSIFLHPFIGRLSDNNTSSLGKRRPFLLVFVTVLTLGCLLQIFASSLPSYAAHVVVIFLGDSSPMLPTLHPRTSSLALLSIPPPYPALTHVQAFSSSTPALIKCSVLVAP